jgi:TRAP-type C4-dicarboxylate transport system permease small subunit
MDRTSKEMRNERTTTRDGGRRTVSTEHTSWLPGTEDLPRGFLGALDRILSVLAVVLAAILVLVLFFQVVTRYVFGQPSVWSEELAVSLFPWLAMIAIPLGFRRGEHLTLDLFSKRYSPRMRRVMSIVLCALTVVTFAIIGYLAVQLLPAGDRQLLAGIHQGLGIPAKQSWIYLAVPVGSLLSIVFAIERLVLVLRGKVTILNADADETFIENLEVEDDTTQENR